MRSAIIGIALSASLMWGCQDEFPGGPNNPTPTDKNWKVAFTETVQTTPQTQEPRVVVTNADGTGREEIAQGATCGQAGKGMVAYGWGTGVHVAMRTHTGTWQHKKIFEITGSGENIAGSSIALSLDGSFITFSTTSQAYGRKTYLTSTSAATNAVGEPLPIMLSHESTPIFSRDGRKMAFYGRPAGQNDNWSDPVSLYVFNTNGSGYVKIADLDLYTLDGGSWLDISPDGSRIAFEEREPGTTNETKWVCVANTDGSGTIRKFTQISCYPIWNGDGTKIIYIGGTNADLMMINADGSGTPQNLTNTPDQLELWPQLSPDGSQLMYTAYANDPERDPGSLYTIEIANPASKTLLSNNAYKGFWIREGSWAAWFN